MNNSSKQSKTTNLHQKAEALLKINSSETGLPLSEIETLKLVHELEVHQIELELINEELMLASSAAQNATEKYSELFDFAPSGYFILSKEGKIIDLNVCGAQILGKEPAHLKNSVFDFFVSDDTKPVFHLFLDKVFNSKAKETCQLTLSINGNLPIHIYLTGVVAKNKEQCFVTLVDITERKLSEIELREKEVQYQNLANSGLALIWAADTDKSCNYFNEPWLKFTGRTLDQELGNGWAEGVHPDDLDRCLETYATAFDKREEFNMEYRLRHVSGEYRWIWDMGTPNYNSSGEFIGYIGNCLDITERKQTEFARNESDERFQLLFNNAPLGYQSLDIDGHFLEVNQQWLDTLGYRREEVIGKWFGDFLTPMYQDGFRKRFPIFKAQGHIHSEFEMVHKDGSILFIAFEGRIGKDLEGNFKQTHCILQDITESKRANEALIKSREDFMDLFDNAPIGYHEIDAEGRIVRMNQTELNMLGYTFGELVGKHFWSTITEEKVSRKAIEAKLSGEYVPLDFFEREFRKKDGTTLSVLLKDKLFKSKDGLVTGIRTTVQDITERKKAESALLESEKEYRTLLDMSPVAKCILRDWTLIYVNHSAIKLFGAKSSKDLVNKPILELIHPDFHKLTYENAKLLAKKGFVPKQEQRFVRIDGNVLEVETQSKSIRFNGKQATLVDISDITERKQSEEKIIKLSRVNLVLSNVNQSIVHIRDKQELFNQVCKIAIEDGKLRMAWIGIINPQTNKVDVVASYGIVNGYLDTIDIDLNYPDRSNGPTGKSINTAQHYYSNSIKTNEAMLPWRENAVSRGYNSAISLPLFLAGKVIGNFTLYSEEENYFNPDEIELLDKLAMNISFAMDYLENESERKNAEDALRESKSKLDAALASTTDAIFITDAEGNYIEYNDAFVKYLRFSSKDELLANFNDFSDIIQVNYSNGEIAPSEMWAVPRALRGETATNVEYKLLRKDTGESWVGSYSFSPMRDDKGEIVGSVIVARDVTELKQAEKALSESEEKFRTLFASMTEMVAIHELVFNEKGEAVNYIITDCNDAFCRNIGIKKENIIGRLANEVYQTEKAPFLEKYTRVAITGKSFEHNIYYPPLDKHFLISAVSPGKNMFSTITNDITVIQKAHEEIDQKNKELENYIYVASHDLRSPLVNIQGFSQRLQKQTEEIKHVLTANEPDNETKDSLAKITNETLPKTLNFILTNVKKMDTLINGLLQVSRTGRITMVITKIDMNRLINTILSHYSFQITEMKAEVSITDLPDCYGDENQLNQLFSNIIGNALKYRDKNRPLELKIAAKTHYNKVIYSISDTGIGIHQRDIEKIWNVFYRVDSTVSEAGDGIGLSLVKRIADKHKGKIWVESEEGKGSTFYVELQKNEFVE